MQPGLLKGYEIHALVRKVAFVKQGHVTTRDQYKAFFPLAWGYMQATIPDYGWYSEKVDKADLELATSAQTASNTLWG